MLFESSSTGLKHTENILAHEQAGFRSQNTVNDAKYSQDVLTAVVPTTIERFLEVNDLTKESLRDNFNERIGRSLSSLLRIEDYTSRGPLRNSKVFV